MADMSKSTSENTKKDTTKEFEFEVVLPRMTTPLWLVTVGAISVLFADGRIAYVELFVGCGLMAVGCLVEFLDRWLQRRSKTQR